MKFLISLMLVLSVNVFAQNISADVELFPAGDFTAKSSGLTGYMVKKDGKLLLGTPLKVKVDSFDSGLSLRNTHMKKYMGEKKQPIIIVKKAAGKGGEGVALLGMNGKSNKIKFKYAEDGKVVKISFSIELSKFGIDDVSYQGVGVEDEVEVKAVVPLK